jgi:quercetin dioxygenase-like cupin family protein
MPVITAPIEPTHELPGTTFTSLATPTLGPTATSVWKVSIAPGTEPAPHSLSLGEVFVVLQGTARVRIGDTMQAALAGDVIIVPADTEFELVNAGVDALEAICCMPVGGRARVGTGDAFTPPWAQ